MRRPIFDRSRFEKKKRSLTDEEDDEQSLSRDAQVPTRQSNTRNFLSNPTERKQTQPKQTKAIGQIAHLLDIAWRGQFAQTVRAQSTDVFFFLTCMFSAR
jgi:hypothetical protein